MPYGPSKFLPFETASRLGHLSVIEDPLVKQLLESFEKVEPEGDGALADVTEFPLEGVEPLTHVIAVDGSLSVVPNSLIAQKTLAYVKVGALCISLQDLERAAQPIVDPEFVRGLMVNNTTTFSTVLPLNNISVPGQSIIETIRAVIRTTFETVVGGRTLETLVFLTSRQWDPKASYDARFGCPFCGDEMSLPRDTVDFDCATCGKPLSVIDYLALDREVNEASNDEAIARNLMLMLEHLTVIDYIRQLAEHQKDLLGSTVVLKDGPLMLPGQYSRLVEPVREYLRWLASERKFFLAGVEKTGAFVEHAHFLGERLRGFGRVFLPSNEYVLGEIKHMSPGNTKYGERVLYGTKVLIGLDQRNVAVITVPTGAYVLNPSVSQLIGFDRILATLGKLIARQHQDALMPIVAANQLVSMSFYPSNDILAKYADAGLGVSFSG